MTKHKRYRPAYNRTTRILSCWCTHEGQDKEHGEQFRLHNKCKDGWRCSSCGTIRDS